MRKEELRPCIVREIVENISDDGDVGVSFRTHNGFFHRWYESSMEKNGSKINHIFGIVEYEDGTVHNHYPSEIQFTDREEEDS